MKLISKIAAAALFISVTVHASNFSFLGNSAMSFFTKEDWKISKTAQNKALNNLEDGTRLAWRNPGTGTHGVFLPKHTHHANGAICRDLEILHTANMVKGKAVYRFCKLNNQWKIV
jgi:surface antigen